MRAPHTALQRRAAVERPSPWVGPGLGVAGIAGIVVAAVTGVFQLTVLGGLALCVGVVETSRAVDGWLVADAVRGHDVVVVRRFGHQAILQLPGINGVARRFHRAFAFANARAWSVEARAPIDVDVTIERRGLLSRGGVRIDDDAFDKAFVLDATDIDGAHLAMRLPPTARAALVRLFLQREVLKVRFSVDGAMAVWFDRRGSDPAPIVNALPALRSLLEGLGQRQSAPAPLRALRAHSPDGNPLGWG